MSESERLVEGDGVRTPRQPEPLTIVQEIDLTSAPVEAIPPAQVSVITRRFLLGVGLAIVSILAVAILLACSLRDAPTLAEVTKIPPESAPLAFGILALHAAIVVAGVLFCYQLLRAGERLLMPFWVLNPGPYLGVKTPPQAASNNLEELVKALIGALKRDEPKDGD